MNEIKNDIPKLEASRKSRSARIKRDKVLSLNISQLAKIIWRIFVVVAVINLLAGVVLWFGSHQIVVLGANQVVRNLK